MATSARVIQERRFTTALRGYDRDEVIAFLAEVAADMATLEEHLAIARARAAKSQEQLDSLNDVLERHIADTHAARAAIIEEAKKEATEILATARPADDSTPDVARSAAAIVAEAESRAEAVRADAERRVAEAEASASDIVRLAEQTAAVRIAESDRVLDEARGTARRIRSDAEREREDILSRLGRIRSLLGDVDPRALADAKVILSDGGQVVIDLRDPAVQPAPSSHG
jgi:DivIVA domain-containing protein